MVGSVSLPDALTDAGFVFMVSSVAIYLTAIARSSVELDQLSDLLYAIGAWLVFVACLMVGAIYPAAVFGVLAVLATRRWWNGRRKGRGRKALKELGDKSRRRVQALVDRMTPSPIPSPAGALS